MTGRRVTIVASELLGRPGTGGAGTADSLLAVALARHGHRVELLVASGRDIQELNPRWRELYTSAGVAIRILERIDGVRPSYLAPAYEVYRALRDRPPDVAIVNDWRGLGFLALRARQTGLALGETAFVVHCHGPGRVLTEFAQKVPDTLERFGEAVMERWSVALADAVVSPSRWLLDWMRGHGWDVPEPARVIQYVRESAALGETATRPDAAAPIERLAFFGQLREGKGIRIFIAALERLDPKLLEGRDVLFVGSETRRWTRVRILDAIAPEVRGRLAVDVLPHLTREDALDELRRRPTLAVMPSLLDNSPNTVSECIEHGIPFLAAATGGIPELVADEDRERVLFRPTVADLADALTRALPTFAPARAAQPPEASVEAWLEVVAQAEPRPAAAEADDEAVLLCDEGVVPDEGLDAALRRAQAASGADVVTAAVRPADDPDEIQLFLGDPGALGLVENQYGVAALVRRSLLDAEAREAALWPLLARLTLGGARVVSLPEPLATLDGDPGRAGDVPGHGLAVLEAFEAAPAAVPDLPQLAATLGAANERLADAPSDGATAGRGSLAGVLRRLRSG